MFKKILIANRGEIACRVIKTCQRLGVKTVAVYSKADADSRHVKLADEAVCIGPAPSAKSYLNRRAIIRTAKKKKAEAVHPGYGFLSEDATFARDCRKAGIKFIGPAAEAIDLMGDKSAARSTMHRGDVPIIPGSLRPLSNLDNAFELASEIGYPVVVKASAGGGGRGMRIAESGKELVGSIKESINEAQSSFGSCSVYVEKYMQKARHIEIQVLADRMGNYLHLGERDCSLQRRHQKVIEESPSTAISNELRQKMAYSALRASATIDYEGAGTVEFILDENNEFYFLEMNTRIQVEHPVTEMITGVDIVEQQLRIAAGEELPFSQSDVKFRGHAIECRINAEDPYLGFIPCPGKITDLKLPSKDLARVDTHIYKGYTVPPHYDSLLGKITVHETTRLKAIKAMLQALEETEIEGVTTNIPFHKSLLNHNMVTKNEIHTKFVEDIAMPTLMAAND